jgi:hypothetical protein
MSGKFSVKNGLLLVALCSMVFPVMASTIRCKSALLTEGDTSAELLIKCGAPLIKEPLVVSAISKTGELTQVSAGERWTYDMGVGQFMQIVTVQNGVIQKIEDGPRH